MSEIDLAAALTREHHEIDAGIEEFLEALGQGEVRAAPLQQALAALRRHIYLEEEFLFPSVREAGLVMPVMVMVREHGEIWRAMDSLEDRLADRADDEGASAASRELLALLAQHNAKEEPIIYPQAGPGLTPEARATLADFLADFLARGELPDGWTCERAAG